MKFETVAKAAIVAILSGVVAGCGADGSSVHTQGAANLVRPVGDECHTDYTTLATAMEAFVAMTGTLPGSESDLVSANLLRRESEGFDLMLGQDDYEIVPAGDLCAGFDPATVAERSATARSVGMPDCAAQRRTIDVAWEAYHADKGVAPVSESDLVPDYMLVDSVGFDLVAGAIVPVPGMCG